MAAALRMRQIPSTENSCLLVVVNSLRLLKSLETTLTSLIRLTISTLEPWIRTQSFSRWRRSKRTIKVNSSSISVSQVSRFKRMTRLSSRHNRCLQPRKSRKQRSREWQVQHQQGQKSKDRVSRASKTSNNRRCPRDMLLKSWVHFIPTNTISMRQQISIKELRINHKLLDRQTRARWGKM